MSHTAIWVGAIAVAHALGISLLLYALESTTKLFSSRLRRRLGESTKLGTGESAKHGTDSARRSQATVNQESQDVEAQKQHHSGPLRRADLHWSGIGCSVPLPSKACAKTVLDDCFGKVDRGHLCALLGPSGAGKTTLLNVLAHRKTGSGVRGLVTVNGQPLADIPDGLVGYVTQEDNFVAQLSCLETMHFFARLTAPRTTTLAERAARIEHVLMMLGLARVKDSQVGGLLPGGIAVRGVSGGEKRRLSIACALVSQPSLIFMDEPTTGLDSFAALTVVRHMTALAAAGHTVVASIHQPQPAIFDAFDLVSVLSEGRQLYFGPPGGIQSWFEGLGYCHDPRRDGSIADWAMNLISIGFDKPILESKTMSDKADIDHAAASFAKYWTAMTSTKADLTGAEASGASSVNEPCIKERQAWENQGSHFSGRRHQGFVSSWHIQFLVLLERSFLEQIRNPTDMASRVFINCWIGILTGLVFYNLPAGLGSVQPRLSVLFFALLAQQLLPFTYMSFFVANRRFFSADIAARIYCPSAYYAANSLAPFPFVVLNSVLGSLTAYGLAGLRDSPRALALNSAVIALVALISQQLLIFCVWVTPNQDLAYLMATAYVTASILLSGFYQKFSQFALSWIGALSWANYQRYSFTALTRLELEGVVWTPQLCTGALSSGTCASTGDSILVAEHFTLGLRATMPVLIGFLVLVHGLSYIALSKLYRANA